MINKLINKLKKELKFSTNPKNLLLSLQYVFAVFGATILIPRLMGIPSELGLLTSGLGTLTLYFLTRGKVPMFMGTSAGYLATFLVIKESMGVNTAIGSVLGAAITFFILSFIVTRAGKEIVTKLIPRHLAGAIIISLGITLVPISLMLTSSNNTLAFVSGLILVIFCLIGRGIFKLFPIILAIVVSYIGALFLGIVDFQPVLNAQWLMLPRLVKPEFSFGGMGLFALIALSPALENVGDLTTNGMIIGRDHLKETGLGKIYLSNAIALTGTSILGIPPSVTYGESNGVLALTKNYNSKLIRDGAFIMIALSFLGKISALIDTIPLPIMGATSFILFGLLMMSGVNSIKLSNIKLMEFKNAIVVFMPIFISVSSILSDNPLKLVITDNLTFSGLSLSVLVGIVLHIVINFKDIFKRRRV